ncbi:TCR/Tet family MFS transporter [Pseudosulfitobacter pseudonitzschiae]|nr:TCR/Tet family MFS transporter [Pseudosulfitobacter pseudonitzschiae]UFE30548.1 TCR/Tet family MFS transporter [Pseudosulfitobacter pseudonitzschiae]UFE35363.1 TCR/Tet family MFS transporter [Pseudosulfitobacter pseudonitzschiae]UFE39849.1 TCR/Tet family MFS transporter [Pseudosulfitobacter pseudonitzschiae]UFE44375.1 TCR/Tet family MFS transporter [Pseudosulfitobacter pseudonitzschiae]
MPCSTGVKPAVVFLLFTVLLDAMGIGLILPIMPDLIRNVQGGTLAQAALWGGVLSTTFAVMQFLFGPVIGGLSDRFGRRPVLLLSLVVMCLDYMLMAVAGSIWLLLVGRIIGGVAASTQSTANACMADLSAPEDKSANFGLIGAAFGIGFVLGPLIGGLLAEYGTRAPFWAAATLSGLNALFGWLVLRETVTDRIRRAFSWRRANPLGTLRALGQLPQIRRLLVVYFIYQFAFIVYPAIWAYFGHARFNWSPALIGLSLGLFGIAMAVVQGGLIRIALRRFGESGTIVYGLLFSVLTYILIALVTSGTVALILTPLAALGGVIAPALQGIMSKATGDDQQGELQGAMVSVNALAMILSPMVMTSVFYSFTAADAPIHLPGAPFVLSALLTGLALVIYLRPIGTRIT